MTMWNQRILFCVLSLCVAVAHGAPVSPRDAMALLRDAHRSRALAKDEDKKKEKKEKDKKDKDEFEFVATPPAEPEPEVDPVGEVAAPVSTTTEVACLAAQEGNVYTTDTFQDTVFEFEMLTTQDADLVNAGNFVALKLQEHLASELVLENCPTEGARKLAAEMIRGVAVGQGDFVDRPCTQFAADDITTCTPVELTARVFLEEGVDFDSDEIRDLTLVGLSEAFATGKVPSFPSEGLLGVDYIGTASTEVGNSAIGNGSQGNGGSSSMGPGALFFLVFSVVVVATVAAYFFVARRRSTPKSHELFEDDGFDDESLPPPPPTDKTTPRKGMFSFLRKDSNAGTPESLTKTVTLEADGSSDCDGMEVQLSDDNLAFVITDEHIDPEAQINADAILRDLETETTPKKSTMMEDPTFVEVENITRERPAPTHWRLRAPPQLRSPPQTSVVIQTHQPGKQTIANSVVL